MVRHVLETCDTAKFPRLFFACVEVAEHHHHLILLVVQQVLLLQLVIDVTTVSQEINHQYSTPNKSVLYLEVAQFQNDLLFIRVIILHCCIVHNPLHYALCALCMVCTQAH